MANAPLLPPLVQSKNPGQGPPRVSCYNCDAVNLLDSTRRQWCRACPAPLVPVPAWAVALGWPENAVPKRERLRMRTRAPVPVKAVRFDSDDGRSLAGALEIVARRDRLRINDLMLSLLRAGLEAMQAERRPGDGGR